MARHIVCLTFDFDALSGFIARGLTTPTPISRGEFGVVGAERILALLHRFGIAATWFIPGHTIATYPEPCRHIAQAGHEIAHHGWTHVPPASLTRTQEEAGLVRANEAIQALAGRPARGYRSPSWDLSPHTIELLLQHGFLYDSSMMGHDYLPYARAPATASRSRSRRRSGRRPGSSRCRFHGRSTIIRISNISAPMG